MKIPSKGRFFFKKTVFLQNSIEKKQKSIIGFAKKAISLQGESECWNLK